MRHGGNARRVERPVEKEGTQREWSTGVNIESIDNAMVSRVQDERNQDVRIEVVVCRSIRRPCAGVVRRRQRLNITVVKILCCDAREARTVWRLLEEHGAGVVGKLG